MSPAPAGRKDSLSHLTSETIGVRQDGAMKSKSQPPNLPPAHERQPWLPMTLKIALGIVLVPSLVLIWMVVESRL